MTGQGFQRLPGRQSIKGNHIGNAAKVIAVGMHYLIIYRHVIQGRSGIVDRREHIAVGTDRQIAGRGHGIIPERTDTVHEGKGRISADE